MVAANFGYTVARLSYASVNVTNVVMTIKLYTYSSPDIGYSLL
jgi:hypothetical protein